MMDVFIDELWGLLCPDMGPELWHEAVKALGRGDE